MSPLPPPTMSAGKQRRGTGQRGAAALCVPQALVAMLDEAALMLLTVAYVPVVFAELAGFGPCCEVVAWACGQIVAAAVLVTGIPTRAELWPLCRGAAARAWDRQVALAKDEIARWEAERTSVPQSVFNQDDEEALAQIYEAAVRATAMVSWTDVYVAKMVSRIVVYVAKMVGWIVFYVAKIIGWIAKWIYRITALIKFICHPKYRAQRQVFMWLVEMVFMWLMKSNSSTDHGSSEDYESEENEDND